MTTRLVAADGWVKATADPPLCLAEHPASLSAATKSSHRTEAVLLEVAYEENIRRNRYKLSRPTSMIGRC